MSAQADGTYAAALGYAAHGWPVFVLSSTKVPVRNCDRCRAKHTTPEAMEACECLTCHGFHAATTDLDRITAMFERHPGGLLAVRTGAVSGTVVVDVDPPTGTRTLARLDEVDLLPGTVTSMTGRPCGIQLFFAHPGVRIASRPGGLGPGVDIKADDAYVVAPPSVHPRTRRAYRWSGNGRYDYPLTPLHPVLVERLRAPVPLSAVSRSSGPGIVIGQPSPGRGMFAQPSANASPYNRLQGLVTTVLRAVEGERNATLHWAACRVADMATQGDFDPGAGVNMSAAVEALANAAAQIGLTPPEISATINSGCPGAGVAA